jgi:flagellar hook protein FlgE
MMSGMYAAISGLDANQTMLNTVSNDLANVNTVGYKGSSVQFADSLTQVLRGASGATGGNGGSNPVQVGLGVQVNATVNEMSEGAFESTNNPLDVAIEGSGFLRVGAGSPPALPSKVQYTRAGDLTTNSAGYLTTQSGEYVIGRAAVVGKEGATEPGTTDTYLVIPPGSADVTIGQDGSVSYQNENPESPEYGKQVLAGYISLAQFPNEAGLERLGGSLWAQTASSGAPIVGTPDSKGFGATVSGELEMSNVDLASEMTSMITAERGYQANSRVITTADEMLQTVVSMIQ